MDLKVTNNGFPPNNRETLPAQCVVRREKMKYPLFFIVRTIDLQKNCSIFDSPTVQFGINYLRALLASKNETKIIALAK